MGILVLNGLNFANNKFCYYSLILNKNGRRSCQEIEKKENYQNYQKRKKKKEDYQTSFGKVRNNFSWNCFVYIYV